MPKCTLHPRLFPRPVSLPSKKVFSHQHVNCKVEKFVKKIVRPYSVRKQLTSEFASKNDNTRFPHLLALTYSRNESSKCDTCCRHLSLAKKLLITTGRPTLRNSLRQPSYPRDRSRARPPCPPVAPHEAFKISSCIWFAPQAHKT